MQNKLMNMAPALTGGLFLLIVSLIASAANRVPPSAATRVPVGQDGEHRYPAFCWRGVYAIYVFYTVIVLGKGNSNRAGFLEALTNSSK
jgi:hypothetical protein